MQQDIIMADGNGHRASQISGVIARLADQNVRAGVVVILAGGDRQDFDMQDDTSAIVERDRILGLAGQ